jgi:hypothetical protein
VYGAAGRGRGRAAEGGRGSEIPNHKEPASRVLRNSAILKSISPASLFRM